MKIFAKYIYDKGLTQNIQTAIGTTINNLVVKRQKFGTAISSKKIHA